MHILHFHPEERVWKETTPSHITNYNESQKIQSTQTIEILRKGAVNNNHSEERQDNAKLKISKSKVSKNMEL